jgi:outer membrane protein OmpA-like peptidoglycan-associated protein/tetratricopeptide (TPR) repeat protein
VILLSQAEFAVAQKNLNEGNKYFDRNMFEEAIPYYLKEIETGKNPKFKNAAKEQLANSYRLTGRFLEASEMFKKILEKGSKNAKAENYLNYASSLKNAAKYEEAADIFRKYIELAPTDPMGKVYLESCINAQKWLDQEADYYIKNLEVINTPGSEYAPAFFRDGIVFSSARPDSKKKFINVGDNIDVMRSDLYYINLKNLQDPLNTVENLEDLNSYLHDGTATFSNSGKEVYFARTITGEKNKKSTVVLNSLQIFYSKIGPEGKWSQPVSAFSFNSDKYSIAQPSLSKDGKRIYYISDMPGGFGTTDIYYSQKDSTGKWGQPTNLGPSINTFGHELFPGIYGNDTLYFSSETHPGMGKLDIFRSVYHNNKWDSITNLGNPINSIGDDFAIVLDESQTRGYFSSDRFNGKGKEDIYTLYKIGPQYIYLNGNNIKFPDYTLFNGITYKISEEGATESIALASENGYYSYPLKDSVNYTVNLRRDGFFYAAFRVTLLRNIGDSLLVAKIQAKSTSFFVGGILSDTSMKITSESKLKWEPKGFTGESKNEYETIIDTVITETPLPEIPVYLVRAEQTLNKAKTDVKGSYFFADTLKSGKEYTILAQKLPIPEAAPQEEIKEEPVVKAEPKFITVTDTVYLPDPPVQVKKDTVVAVKEIPVAVELPKVTYVSLKGTVLDSLTRKGLQDCEVKLYQGGSFIYKYTSDPQGIVALKIEDGLRYDLFVTKEGFFQSSIALYKNKTSGAYNDNFILLLKPIVKNKTIELRNILFDFNKYTLRKESYPVLNQLADFLNSNPDITIELNAHTDTRGDYYPNLILSYKRAEAAREYLASKGIAGARIFANGFGETFPLVKNARTEWDHEQNRRVELKVIENNGRNVSQTGFSVLSINPYSKENPFPANIPVPEGQVYRIKLGSFDKEVPYDAFQGIFPVVQEFDKQNQTYTYYAGLFNNADAVANALSIVKNKVTPEAATQAYYNTVPVTQEELQKRIDGSSVFTGVEEDKPKELPVFSIQIGAFKSPVKAEVRREFKVIAGKYGLFTNENNGNIIYSIGNFKNYTDAFNVKQELLNEGLANESFIIALINGRKIPVSEANEMIGGVK